jgi:hypothetical protein
LLANSIFFAGFCQEKVFLLAKTIIFFSDWQKLANRGTGT